jgi:hypothetical protein
MSLAQVRKKKAVIQDSPASSPAKRNTRDNLDMTKQLPSPPFVKSATTKISPPSPSSAATPKKRKVAMQLDSDSDESVLNDSTPPVSKSRKTSKTAASNLKPPPKIISSKPATSSAEDEIKFLKSLVFKCGVRKNWYLVHCFD